MLDVYNDNSFSHRCQLLINGINRATATVLARFSVIPLFGSSYARANRKIFPWIFWLNTTTTFVWLFQLDFLALLALESGFPSPQHPHHACFIISSIYNSFWADSVRRSSMTVWAKVIIIHDFFNMPSLKVNTARFRDVMTSNIYAWCTIFSQRKSISHCTCFFSSTCFLRAVLFHFLQGEICCLLTGECVTLRFLFWSYWWDR